MNWYIIDGRTCWRFWCHNWVIEVHNSVVLEAQYNTYLSVIGRSLVIKDDTLKRRRFSLGSDYPDAKRGHGF